MSEKDQLSEKQEHDAESNRSEIDLLAFHEQNAGRLIVNPEEAKIELGEEVAARLKLTQDGTKVLWPQPTDSEKDPQNWTDRRKNFQLLIITLAAIVPDFDSGIGIASLFPLAAQFNTSTDEINNLTSKMGKYFRCNRHAAMGSPAGSILVSSVSSRLPRWLHFCAQFTDVRCYAVLDGILWHSATSNGLYVVTDLYPFHLQARKVRLYMNSNQRTELSHCVINLLLSAEPVDYGIHFISLYLAVPLRISGGSNDLALGLWDWKHLRALGGPDNCILRIYDRTVRPTIPEPETTGLRYRIETLIGITGWKMAKYRVSWTESTMAILHVVWRPHLFFVLVFEAMLFGFGIGINVTNVVFLGTPKEEGGYGFSQFAIAGTYGTPIVSVLLGELIGRYLNDWIMDFTIKRNKGVFEAESRLWTCYIAVPLYVVGFIVLGAAIQNHLNVGALVMGWGIAELAIMINTVAVYAYGNNCFPKHQGEVSALINLARTLGGFAVAYFQVPWALGHGAIQTFGCEAAIVVGLFILVVPITQWKGRDLRARYSLH
ncbi:hypothetical protein NP233_g3860 [Leucocoprinus birnbaumii]|uniref:MFS general substrate transporter n=1 Tax=Leucocoprinus birnbaumii TaxID=56174 RepID=A0AAD5YTI1_9AGAR|nr:hypothetical protein NP233_g3860 [Leucocoprinus birnbaumii]